MALRPLIRKRFVVPGGYMHIGMGAPLDQGAGDVSPAEIEQRRVPPGVQRAMYKPLHSGNRPYDMQWGPPVKYVRIPRGENGTVATLKAMKGVVLSKWGHRNPEVVLLAKKIADGTSPGAKKNYRAMAQGILDFMKTNVENKSGAWNQAPMAQTKQNAGIDYQLDPAGLEWIQTPWYTLVVTGSGDCDDMSIAAAGLAMALGFQAAFRTVKGDPGRPNQWSHVYPMIGIQEKGKLVWVSADGTQPESYLGWDPPEGKLFGKKTWVIDPSLAEGPEWDD